MKRTVLFVSMAIASLAWGEDKSIPVYVSWDAHNAGGAIPCHCADGNDFIKDPYTGALTARDCLRPRGCADDYITPMAQVFPSQEEAIKFEARCSTNTCTNWQIRNASHDEVLQQFLVDRKWDIDQVRSQVMGGYCVIEKPDKHPINGGYCIGLGSTLDDAIKVAVIFEAHHWKLLGWTSGWGVFADPNNEIADMPLGYVTDGHGTPLPPLASAANPSGAVNKALKIAGAK